MILKERLFFHIHKVFKLFNLLFIALFICSLVFLGSFIFSRKEKSLKPICVSPSKAARKKDLAYYKIGTGPLQLSPKVKAFVLPNLKDEILFFGKNSRLDATIYDLLIHIGLKKKPQSLKAISGQRIYLTYVEELEPYLQFSADATPFWIMPYLSESGKAFIEMGLYLKDSSGELLLDERKTFGIEDLLSQEKNKKIINPQFQAAFKVFEKAKGWSNDQLFEVYGGEKYSLLKNHNRIEFPYDKETQIIYVKEGDILIWKEEKWKPEKIGKNSKGYPLAHLKRLNSYQMEWELWDKEGFLKKQIFIDQSKDSHLPHFQIDNIFSRIRQRTTSRISCRIENKSTILKSGDWILRTPTGWRVLKTLSEIKEVLHFYLKGELFIFDGILQKEGKSIFAGTLFDLMRTKQKRVHISLTEQKNKKKSPDKKKPLSTKIQPNFSKNSMKTSQEEKQKNRKRAFIK